MPMRFIAHRVPRVTEGDRKGRPDAVYDGIWIVQSPYF
jgi:hypothetical protein